MFRCATSQRQRKHLGDAKEDSGFAICHCRHVRAREALGHSVSCQSETLSPKLVLFRSYSEQHAANDASAIAGALAESGMLSHTAFCDTRPPSVSLVASMHVSVRSTPSWVTARPPLGRRKEMPLLRTSCVARLLRPASRQTSLRTCNAAAPGNMVAMRDLATEHDRPKGKRWDTVEKWVIFSDLHVSVKTLDICLSVLQKIKKEAVARKAGIVFLGEAGEAICAKLNAAVVAQARTAAPYLLLHFRLL